MPELLLTYLDDQFIKKLPTRYSDVLTAGTVGVSNQAQPVDSDGGAQALDHQCEEFQLVDYRDRFVRHLVAGAEEFCVSIAAVTLALVIAIKELILCFSGAMLRAGTGSFTIGDWVEVGTNRGEVIDYNIFSTTLQELDKPPNDYSFTGKVIVIPNSLFLSEPVKNLNFSKRYVFHRFGISVTADFNVADIQQWILAEIDRCSDDFIEIARRYNAFIEKHTGVDIPGPEPRVMISTGELAKYIITVIIFCPTEKASELEQHITQGVLQRVYPSEAV